MDRVITYSLRRGNSDFGYYQVISNFTDDWVRTSLPIYRDLIDDYHAFRNSKGLSSRSDIASLFDLLVIGVLLQVHASSRLRMASLVKVIMKYLFDLQERYRWSEGVIKFFRGILMRIFSDSRIQHRGSDSLGALLVWLQATGEDAIFQRLVEWRHFFNEFDNLEDVLPRLRIFAQEFSLTSNQSLGSFTEGVDAFLLNEAPRHRWRYDHHLLEHTRLEYHLGMLGTEILNREYRQSFLAARGKIVILPPCMRAQPDGSCKAVQTMYGELCKGCTPFCRINQVTKLGEKNGFGVFIIPDELKVFHSGENQKDIGVVGVSCVLTNWTGGWDAERLGFPAQGVLLDYVGCKYHWDKDGFPTDMDLKELLECLNARRQ